MNTKDAAAESGVNPDFGQVRDYSDAEIQAARAYLSRKQPFVFGLDLAVNQSGASPSEGDALLAWMDQQGNPVTHQRITDFRAGYKWAQSFKQTPAAPACTVCDDRGFYTEPYSRDRAKVPCTFCPSAPSSTASATTTAAEAPLGNNA